MRRYPWLWAGTAAALGAAVVLPSGTDRRVLLACGLAALCVWMLQRDLSKALRACVAAALVAGALSSCLHETFSRSPLRAHTTRISCTVSSDVVQEDFGSSYACDADAGGTIAVAGAGGASTGDHLMLRGRLEPFDAPRNPGEPDQREIERERGFVARLSGAGILHRLPPARATPAILLARAHAWALAQLRARLTEPSAAILAGELWGERSALSPDLRAEFQETGTVHILVTAGLHLGVVAGIVLCIVGACRLPRFASCAIAAASVWAYAVFSGMHVPVMRAATMISFGLAAYAAGAAPLSWNAYGAALLAIAMCDPLALSSASFALSFSCVGAILLCANPIAEALQTRAALPHAVREAFALTIATQLGTWPQTAATFLLFAPYAIAANVLVVPAVGATMILGGAQLALSAVPALAQAAANLNAWLLAWIVGCVQRIADLPGASIPMTPAPAWAIAAYDAALVAAVFAWQRSARTAAIAFFVTGVALVVAPPVMSDERLRIVVLDVGQADGIVIRTPLGRTILVDAGGRLERGSGGESIAERVGELTVVPYLRRAGVRSIDAIVLSHPHGDHNKPFAQQQCKEKRSVTRVHAWSPRSKGLIFRYGWRERSTSIARILASQADLSRWRKEFLLDLCVRHGADP